MSKKAWCRCCLVANSCLILCDSNNCSPQAPLSMGCFRQDYWSRLPFPSLEPDLLRSQCVLLLVRKAVEAHSNKNSSSIILPFRLKFFCPSDRT